MDVHTAQRLLDRMRELPIGLEATATTVRESIYHHRWPHDAHTLSPLSGPAQQDNSYTMPLGYELEPKFAETLEEFNRAIQCFDAGGKPVQNSVGENIVVHLGERSRHRICFKQNAASEPVFDSLCNWAHSNWAPINKIASLGLYGGVSFRAGSHIWLDFVIAIAKHELLVSVEEWQTKVAEQLSMTRSSVELLQAGKMDMFGSMEFIKQLPEGWEPEVWFTENKHVWENSIRALEWLINASKKAENKKTRKGVGGRPANYSKEDKDTCKKIVVDCRAEHGRDRLGDDMLGEFAMKLHNLPDSITAKIPNLMDCDPSELGKLIKKAAK